MSQEQPRTTNSFTRERMDRSIADFTDGLPNGCNAVLVFGVGFAPEKGEIVGGGLAGVISLGDLEMLHIATGRAIVKSLSELLRTDRVTASRVFAEATMQGAARGDFSSGPVEDKSAQLAEEFDPEGYAAAGATVVNILDRMKGKDSAN